MPPRASDGPGDHQSCAFGDHDRTERFALGHYYGIILVMVFYNLFLFVALRDRSYLYYVLVVFAWGLWFTEWNGSSRQYLWTDSSWGWYRVYMFLSRCVWICKLLFVRNYLHTSVNTPRLDRFLILLMGASGLLSAAALFDLHRPVLPFSLMFFQIEWWSILAAGVLSLRGGYRPARYFLIAWLGFISGSSMIILTYYKVVPWSFLTVHGMQIGHAVEAAMLALGLADRINVLRQEKEQEEANAREATFRARTLELQAQTAENKTRKKERDQARDALARERRRRMAVRPHTIDHWRMDDFVGSCPAMQSVYAQARALQQDDGRALIIGEQGTGKELLARAIHSGSSRRDAAFVAARCAELPTGLDSLEVRTKVLSTLIGHVANAFPGATADHDGLLLQAHGGTLFFDEVGLLPVPLQGQILRALQQAQVRRTGAATSQDLDVRVLAATSEDLEEMETAGFSNALHDYLAATRIVVPPLRDRGEDIIELAQQLADEHMVQAGLAPVPLDPRVTAKLREYAFPGNVRQLAHIMRDALAAHGEGPLAPEDLYLPE